MAQNVEIVRRWWEEFNSKGMPPLDLCAEEVEIRIPDEFPFTGVYRGHEGVRRWVMEVFDVFDRPHVELGEIVEADDSETVVMSLRAVGRTRQMDFEADFPWAALWVIREGKLVYARGYLATADALEAAGLTD